MEKTDRYLYEASQINWTILEYLPLVIDQLGCLFAGIQTLYVLS